MVVVEQMEGQANLAQALLAYQALGSRANPLHGSSEER